MCAPLTSARLYTGRARQFSAFARVRPWTGSNRTLPRYAATGLPALRLRESGYGLRNVRSGRKPQSEDTSEFGIRWRGRRWCKHSGKHSKQSRENDRWRSIAVTWHVVFRPTRVPVTPIEDATPQMRSDDGRLGFKIIFQKPPPLLALHEIGARGQRAKSFRVCCNSHCKHRERKRSSVLVSHRNASINR